jgi:hypothetical protein
MEGWAVLTIFNFETDSPVCMYVCIYACMYACMYVFFTNETLYECMYVMYYVYMRFPLFMYVCNMFL